MTVTAEPPIADAAGSAAGSATAPPADLRADREVLASLAEAMATLDHPTKVDVSRWAAAELAQFDRVAADRESGFALDDWRRCAERGVHGLMVPVADGGQGADLATTLLTLEGLGHGCRDNGLIYAITSQMLSTQVALAEFANPEQKERYLRPLLTADRIGAFAMTEPEAGSDAYSITARAVRTDDGFSISGHKTYITLASRCDFVIVFASTNPEVGRWGLSAFIVPMDTPGVERVGNREKMGMRTTPFGDIKLHDVEVPADALLGREGAGASIFNAVLEVERAFVFAPAIGVTERVLDESIAFSKAREQGGAPISTYQAVAHRLVEMKRRHETARLFLYRAALSVALGRDVATYAALAKLVASETGIEAALQSVEVHGARGYVSEYEVERNVRDAIGGLVYSGTSDIQRNIVARLLGVG